MLISLNWINDYVDLKGIDYKDLVNKLTLSCAEVEGAEVVNGNFDNVVAGKIIECEKHPKSNKLHLLKVDVGKTVLDIVCGAKNARVGIIVPVALIGAKIGDITIDKAVVGGYNSYGMCCSAKELAIGDDNSGIMELDENTVVGTDLRSVLGVKDVVIEIDNKSLTNRPDLWGHYGIAREIAALYGRELKPLKSIELENLSDLPKVQVDVESSACYRYTSCIIKNITKKVSTQEMQLRLYRAGMRGINLLADITNYVMLELGTPMHAFDSNIVNKIKVEDVKEETKFVTLDNQERVLPKGTMVISDGKQPVAIAGVMGGLNSEITDNTNSVLVESACFDGSNVRKTALNLGLRTEASARYEKMLDPELTMLALQRYYYLLKQMDNGAEIASNVTDVYKFKYPEKVIKITKEFIDNYIGIDIAEEEIVKILTSLQFQVKVVKKGEYEVKVPSFRATKDINGKADLVEEVTRVYGYDNIEPKSPLQPVEPVKLQDTVKFEYDVKYMLASKFNYHEVHSRIWYDDATNQKLGINPVSHIRVKNSIEKDSSEIRSTMLPNLLSFVLLNKNNYSQVSLFEIGRVVLGINKQTNLADENKNLAIVLASKTKTTEELLKELRDACYFVCEEVIKTNFEVIPTTKQNELFHPVNHYEILNNGNLIGQIGMLHPRVKNNLDKKLNVVMAELDFDKLIISVKNETKFEKVSKYQNTTLDFSFALKDDMLYCNIESIANNINTNLNYKLNLIDIFEDKNKNEKSYTLRYNIWANDHTMTGEEISEFHKTVIKNFENNNIKLKDM